MSDSVSQVVPLLLVQEIERSVRFYVDSLGFVMTKQWVDEGKLRWCWLEIGGAALMLQELWYGGPHTNVPTERVGVGVSLNFICTDAIALYHRFLAHGVIPPKTPFVGNGMWVTHLVDPDGYNLYFESVTSEPEETVYSADRVSS